MCGGLGLGSRGATALSPLLRRGWVGVVHWLGAGSPALSSSGKEIILIYFFKACGCFLERASWDLALAQVELPWVSAGLGRDDDGEPWLGLIELAP